MNEKKQVNNEQKILDLLIRDFTVYVDQNCFQKPDEFNRFADLAVPTLRKYNLKLNVNTDYMKRVRATLASEQTLKENLDIISSKNRLELVSAKNVDEIVHRFHASGDVLLITQDPDMAMRVKNGEEAFDGKNLYIKHINDMAEMENFPGIRTKYGMLGSQATEASKIKTIVLDISALCSDKTSFFLQDLCLVIGAKFKIFACREDLDAFRANSEMCHFADATYNRLDREFGVITDNPDLGGRNDEATIRRFRLEKHVAVLTFSDSRASEFYNMNETGLSGRWVLPFKVTDGEADVGFSACPWRNDIAALFEKAKETLLANVDSFKKYEELSKIQTAASKAEEERRKEIGDRAAPAEEPRKPQMDPVVKVHTSDVRDLVVESDATRNNDIAFAKAGAAPEPADVPPATEAEPGISAKDVKLVSDAAADIDVQGAGGSVEVSQVNGDGGIDFVSDAPAKKSWVSDFADEVLAEANAPAPEKAPEPEPEAPPAADAEEEHEEEKPRKKVVSLTSAASSTFAFSIKKHKDEPEEPAAEAQAPAEPEAKPEPAPEPEAAAPEEAPAEPEAKAEPEPEPAAPAAEESPQEEAPEFGADDVWAGSEAAHYGTPEYEKNLSEAEAAAEAAGEGEEGDGKKHGLFGLFHGKNKGGKKGKKLEKVRNAVSGGTAAVKAGLAKTAGAVMTAVGHGDAAEEEEPAGAAVIPDIDSLSPNAISGVEEKVEAAAETVEEKIEAAAEAVEEKVEAAVETVEEKVETATEAAGETIDAVAETVEEKAEAATEAVGETIETVTETVEEKAEAAAEAAGETIDAVTETVEEKAETAAEAVEETTDAAAVAVGEQVETVTEAVEEQAAPVAEAAETIAEAAAEAVEEQAAPVAETVAEAAEEKPAAGKAGRKGRRSSKKTEKAAKSSSRKGAAAKAALAEKAAETAAEAAEQVEERAAEAAAAVAEEAAAEQVAEQASEAPATVAEETAEAATAVATETAETAAEQVAEQAAEAAEAVAAETAETAAEQVAEQAAEEAEAVAAETAEAAAETAGEAAKDKVGEILKAAGLAAAATAAAGAAGQEEEDHEKHGKVKFASTRSFNFKTVHHAEKEEATEKVAETAAAEDAAGHEGEDHEKHGKVKFASTRSFNFKTVHHAEKPAEAAAAGETAAAEEAAATAAETAERAAETGAAVAAETAEAAAENKVGEIPNAAGHAAAGEEGHPHSVKFESGHSYKFGVKKHGPKASAEDKAILNSIKGSAEKAETSEKTKNLLVNIKPKKPEVLKEEYAAKGKDVLKGVLSSLSEASANVTAGESDAAPAAEPVNPEVVKPSVSRFNLPTGELEKIKQQEEQEKQRRLEEEARQREEDIKLGKIKVSRVSQNFKLDNTGVNFALGDEKKAELEERHRVNKIGLVEALKAEKTRQAKEAEDYAREVSTVKAIEEYELEGEEADFVYNSATAVKSRDNTPVEDFEMTEKRREKLRNYEASRRQEVSVKRKYDNASFYNNASEKRKNNYGNATNTSGQSARKVSEVGGFDSALFSDKPRESGRTRTNPERSSQDYARVNQMIEERTRELEARKEERVAGRTDTVSTQSETVDIVVSSQDGVKQGAAAAPAPVPVSAAPAAVEETPVVKSVESRDDEVSVASTGEPIPFTRTGNRYQSVVGLGIVNIPRLNSKVYLNNKEIVLDKPIILSQSLAIFENDEDPNTIIKIFGRRDLNATMIAKLDAMMENQLSVPGIEWPLSLVRDDASCIVGCVMRNVNTTSFQTMCNSKDFYFHNYDRADMVRLALDYIDKVSKLHELNVFLGVEDLNSIAVSKEKKLSFINMEKMQIGDFPYLPMQNAVTAPELAVEGDVYMASELSDRFVIADTLFKILFLGRSPYVMSLVQGVPADKFLAFRFPENVFDPIVPPKDEAFYIWSYLPQYIKEAFIASLSSGYHDPARRKTTAEWKKLFRQLLADLTSPGVPPMALEISPSRVAVIDKDSTVECKLCRSPILKSDAAVTDGLCHHCFNQKGRTAKCSCCRRTFLVSYRDIKVSHDDSPKYCPSCRTKFMHTKTISKCHECGKTYAVTEGHEMMYGTRIYSACPECILKGNNVTAIKK